MNVTARVEDALFEMVSDIEPAPFQREVRSVIEQASLTPAVLTVLTARSIDSSVDLDEAARRGAAVQLHYEGLRLTRRLSREEPWTTTDDPEHNHVELLVSEVLVARALYHLSSTGAAERTVEIARRFGRRHTNERDPDATVTEPTLEADVVQLAVHAGADLALTAVPAELFEYAESLAATLDDEPFPDHEAALDGVDDEIEGVLARNPVGYTDNN